MIITMLLLLDSPSLPFPPNAELHQASKSTKCIKKAEEKRGAKQKPGQVKEERAKDRLKTKMVNENNIVKKDSRRPTRGKWEWSGVCYILSTLLLLFHDINLTPA